MSSFAEVHRPEDLVRACEDIAAFLAFHCKKQPASRCGVFAGIWLGPSIEGDLGVEASTLPSWFGTSRDSVGVSGIWSLYWLKSDRVCRLALVDLLLEMRAPSAEGTVLGRFIPVFRDDLPASEVQSEVDRLWRYHPLCVLPPLWQESRTGRILLPHDYVALTKLSRF
ncbi:hypothetical protein [Halomonas faecis]|uniref:hypothetical protein n=1 Tax=Halomonas faecis TaxID=1562110 RepID=UPI0013D8824A|nr:hypothetical protein [Halomonas faecis]